MRTPPDTKTLLDVKKFTTSPNVKISRASLAYSFLEGVLEVTSFVKIICHRSQRTNGRDDDSVERWAVARDILLT
jgi:hypothetical protein